MSEKRIQFSNVVQNQLPSYVREEFPLISEFLKQYYISQEFQGAPIDLLNNIDQYIKLNEITNLSDSVILSNDLEFGTTTINIDLLQSPSGTRGFPNSYGLLKINDEIITYTGITTSSFTGCIRGFSGITTYITNNKPEQLTFSSSNSAEHQGSDYNSSNVLIRKGDEIKNLSILFLKEFLIKLKKQFLPGLENRKLTNQLNQNLFIKQSKDFYSTRGTDRSFEILFKSLYNEEVKIVRPSDYLFTPSSANYQVVKNLVVEAIEGDPLKLENSTLKQNQYGNLFTKAYAPIGNISKNVSGLGQTYYTLSLDAGYDRDSRVDGATYGAFSIHPKTKLIGTISAGATKTYGVTNNGSGNYVFTGDAIGSNPTLSVVVGDILIFNINASGHPFRIKTINSTGTSNNVTTGTLTNNGAQVGTVSWDTNGVAPGIYYYVCQNHTSMRGEILVSSGPTTLDVDSTVGFGNTGELYVTFNDNTNGVVAYTSKSLNQFYGCSGITKTILDKSSIGINTYAYGEYFSYENVGTYSTVKTKNIVKLRINSVIQDLQIPTESYYYDSDDTILIKTLGSRSRDFLSKNWFYNVASKYEVSSISLFDASDNTYRINLKTNHYLKIGDEIFITGTDLIDKNSTITDILSDKSILIKGQGLLSTNIRYTIKRKILKVKSNTFAASNFSTNVQNVYLNQSETSDTKPDKILISSPSIPSYLGQPINTKDRSITFTGTFSGESLTIVDHGFYTGDAIYYTPQKINVNYVDSNSGITSTGVIVKTSLFYSLDSKDDSGKRVAPSGGIFVITGTVGPKEVSNRKPPSEGLYYIKRIDSNTIKLAKTKNDIYNSNFISIGNTSVVDSNIRPYNFRLKTLKPQKLLREISDPILDGESYETKPGFTGILVNGVEILNYKSSDTIYYGKLETIDISTPGFGYDIINPPNLFVSDNVGTGATGYVSVIGSLQEIRILDSGFDYIKTPTVAISGGNGSGANASVNMKLIDHSADFFADSGSARIGIGSTQSTIGFTTYHKFRNAEQVIYQTKSQTAVGGINTNSSYYVSVVGPSTVKLHPTQNDAIIGINTVVLSSFGIGKHTLKSVNKKSVVESITVTSPGINYQNKQKTTNISGINTSLNQITIVNHEYNSGEKIKYTPSETAIGGLTIGTEYYVTKVDNDNFKLSQVGGTTDKEFYYRTQQYVELSSVGVGTHSFNYPDITVTLSGKIGISSIGTETFEARIQPIFRGNVSSVHLSHQGVGYGSSEVINFERVPDISLISGKNAQLLPVINNGKIIEVLVLNSGSNYNSPPNIVINGDGIGAVLTPVIQNGDLTSIKIIESGSGYTQAGTSIEVLSPGTGCKFIPRIKNWRINLFEKHFNTFTQDDGFITEGMKSEYELQYCHLYSPRKLRETLFSTDSSGKTLYQSKDLRKTGPGGLETTPLGHSPIIGWAYDGHPIYGPYGYVTKSGGTVALMKSGYQLNSSRSSGPPTSIYPLGFFVEDYTYKNVSDETVLDENNGRFCVTPEFPKGTYAYFATINTSSIDTVLPFLGYKRPLFPYLVGENFKGIPNKFNFDPKSNQDEYDLNNTNLLRNTEPYNLINELVNYEYLNLPNSLNQKTDITSVTPGQIENIGIITGGNFYKINDSIIFDETGTGGFGVMAKVSKLLGKSVNSVSVATSSINNVEISPSKNKGEYIIICDSPHKFKNTDIINITGLSTTSSKIEGSYSVGIGNTALLTVAGLGTTSSGISTIGITGIVTYFSVMGNFIDLRENDILSIGTERVKVLNVQPEFSRIRVLRGVDGTVAGSAHTVTTILYADPRRLIVNVGFNTSYNYKQNKQIYFDPAEVVGLGTSAGVGIGSTITISNPGAATTIFIPTKTLFIKNHNLETGDIVTYSSNGGSGIVVEDQHNVGVGTTLSNGQTLFVAKIDNNLIGLSTVRVGLGTTGTFVGIASTVSSSTTLFFKSIGVGNTHSLKTNYEVITGEINRNLVTVSTAQTHGLETGHTVNVDINPSISTTFTLTYSDYSRKLLINPQTFNSSGINTLSSIFTVINHGYKTGQKVLHTSTSPSQGLSNNKSYFIVRINDNSFKLSNTYFDSIQLKPSTIGISSASSGTFSLINPPLEVYRNSTLTFDLSSSTLSYINQSTLYPAFELNFYTDENFTKLYDKNLESATFEIQRVGVVGVSTNAKVTLTINEKTPQTLFYKLDSVYDNDLPAVKSEVNVDSEVQLNNRVISKFSLYNGKHVITSISSTAFTYPLSMKPERSSYVSSTSSLRYETDCVHAFGPISQIEIKNKGKNYYALPEITSIRSGIGSGAILKISSTSIGKIKKVKIKDIGFDFASDKTVRPTAAIPQIIKVEALASFDFIGITSAGRGYSRAPKLLVLDGRTNSLVNDVDLRYSLGDSQVKIFKNTFGINNVKPIILPTQNTNGVLIQHVGYNTTSKDVTVKLAVGFSTADSWPFAIGDKVLIENVSIGIGSTGKGFNSQNYNYKLFTLTGVTTNLGGIGSVTYSLNGLVNDGELVGTFSTATSSGRIIPEKHFPVFNPKLKTNNYNVGEIVKSKSSSITGTVESWDSRNTILKISSKDQFISGEIIEGLSSKTQGFASSVTSFDTSFVVGSSSTITQGWQNIFGFLNNNLQRVQDSFYYQKFSYSLKSKVAFDTWKDPVGALNHTLGFKKFADYQLESTLPRDKQTDMKIGLSTELGYVESVLDLTRFVNLNCVFDFDLVRENSINLNSSIISDKIIFSNRILTDYEESIGNRVLLIDDISGLFNSNPRATAFSIVNTFKLSSVRAQKYITFVTDRRYTAQRQLLIVDLIHDGFFAYMNQYGRVETTYDQGSFDFSVSGSDGQLLFYPTQSSINDYNVTCLSYNLDDNLLSTGSTSIGGVLLIDTDSVSLSSGVTTSIVGIASTYSSVKVLVQITPDINSNKFEFEELNIVHDGTNIELLEYGQLTTIPTAFGGSGLGTYHPYFSGSNLKIDFIPNSGVGIGTTGAVNTIQVGLANSSFSGIGTLDLKHARLEVRTTSISSSASPGLTTVGQYPNEYDAAYFVVQIVDTTNNRCQMSEVIVVDDYVDTTTSYDTYDTEFGIVQTHSGLGTIGSRVSAAGTVELLFTPIPSIATQVKVYMNALRHQDDSRDIISFNNGTIETFFSNYTGTERDIKRSFDLKHKSDPIFERYFNGSSSSIVDLTNDTISIPNHFFVTGESVVYYQSGAGTTQAIGIATTTIAGVGSTDKLTPGITTTNSLFIVKVDSNKIKLASSAQNALKFVPDVLDLTSVGIGTLHRFVSTNQNAKVVISLDNIIQSPVVSTAVTTTLADQVFTTDDLIKFSGITSFFGGDLIKISNEIMKIEGVGIGSTNTVKVRREWMGTSLAGYSTGQLVTKVNGNYNIIDNTITFSEAPYGNTPLGTSTNPPDERDWTGITTSSSFHGRSFIRSGIKNSSNDTYHKNYVFDDISSEFNGTNQNFTLKSNGVNVSGITSDAVILINDVFQGRGNSSTYVLNESSGIITISFNGTAQVITSDVGISSFPKGGIIVSVGSTEGSGYQPLVSAGGTVTVSSAGTVQSITIGNTGSGYRSAATYKILTDVSNSVGIGSTIIFLENNNSVFSLLSLLNTGSNCSIGVGTFIEISNVITSVGSTFVQVGTAATSQYAIPSGTQAVIKISNPQTGVVNIGVSTGSVGINTIEHVGYATIISGGISTTVTITNAGSGYTALSLIKTELISHPVSSGSTIIFTSNLTNVNVGNVVSVGTAITNASIVGIASTSFTIGSGSTSPSSIGIGTVITFKKNNPPYVVIDSPDSYSNIPLRYSSSSSGVGTEAKVDIVVGQGSSVIDFEVTNTGYGYRNGDILTVPVGGLTGIPTSANFREFQLTVQNIFTDEFSGWSIGELDVFDNFDELFDGNTQTFQLTKGGLIKSIVAARGSNIIVQDTLLIFINDILQVPGEGYVFSGGSIITFTEAPKVGDTSKIIFYKGSGSVDVVGREIIETVKVGDDLTIGYDASVGQQPYQQEEERIVTSINSTDEVSTVSYFGPGNTEDETLLRPVVWCRQTEDKIINEKDVGKDRELYEPNINHFGYVIKTVGVGSTAIYVDNIRPFFNARNENDTSLTFQNSITIISQENRSGAIATAVVSGLGTISSVVISDGGAGYTTAIVSFGSTVGVDTSTRAFGSVTIGAGGTITGVAITSPGVGYTSSNPPQVLISSPNPVVETNNVSSFSGDSGVIVGFGTTTQSFIDKFIFDFYIPQDSFLRNTTYVGTAITLSSINVNDYFIVYNSNVGIGSTVLISKDVLNNIVGIGTNFVDNVYQVDTAFTTQSTVAGIGLTHVRRVFARITDIGTINFSSTLITFDSTVFTFDSIGSVGSAYTGIVTTSNYFGNFSWGRIDLTARAESNEFNFYGDRRVGGITTSAIVQRTKPLKFKKYLI